MMLALAQGSADSFDWAHEFRPFTALHLITTGICVAMIAAASILGLFWRGTKSERRLRHSWAIFVLCSQVVFVTYYVWPPFDVAYSLPLHICDLAGWIAGLALLTQKRWVRSLLYYWGICLSTQAFITPVLHGPHGYATLEFWAFWGLHLIIVGSAVYEVVVLGFRPTWRDYRTSVIITSTYTVAIFLFNWSQGTNYLYTGRPTPSNPTIIDHLGSWPLRVLWLCLIVTAGFTLFTAVWPINWKRPVSGTFTAERPAPPDP